MITDTNAFTAFESEFNRSEMLSMAQKFELLDALYSQALLFGHFTENDLLEGLEATLTMAEGLNTHVSNSPR